MVTMGSSHAAATADGGDVYAWGTPCHWATGDRSFQRHRRALLIGGEMEPDRRRTVC